MVTTRTLSLVEAGPQVRRWSGIQQLVPAGV